jgi:Tol biopolymer transport system component
MSSLEWMPDLAAALDELVPLEDSSRADWQDVAARAGKRRGLRLAQRRPRRSVRFTIVVALLLLLLAGCATATYLLLRGNGGIALGGNMGQLLVVAPDGSTLHAGHACSAWHAGDTACMVEEPAWSPDGTRVAFVAGRTRRVRLSGHGRRAKYGDLEFLSLYVAAADGTGVRKLAPCGLCGDAEGSNLTWSPDGKWIAFTRQTGHQVSVWVVAANGASLHRLTDCGGRCIDTEPTWSPNGRLLLFERLGDARLGRSLYTIRPDGSHLTKIRSNAADPAWSPNGKLIAFDKVTVRGPEGNVLAYDQGIEIVEADGSHPRWLTPGRWGRGQSPGNPVWSPDGRKLVFLQTPRRGPHSGFRGEIWTMNADGSDKKRLYRSGWGFASGAPPIWSPDGQMIAFGIGANSTSGIFVMNADGTGLKRISPIPFPQLSWQPPPSGEKK